MDGSSVDSYVLHFSHSGVAHRRQPDSETCDSLLRPAKDEPCQLSSPSTSPARAQGSVEDPLLPKLVCQTHRTAEDAAERDLRRFEVSKAVCRSQAMGLTSSPNTREELSFVRTVLRKKGVSWARCTSEKACDALQGGSDGLVDAVDRAG